MKRRERIINNLLFVTYKPFILFIIREIFYGKYKDVFLINKTFNDRIKNYLMLTLTVLFSLQHNNFQYLPILILNLWKESLLI